MFNYQLGAPELSRCPIKNASINLMKKKAFFVIVALALMLPSFAEARVFAGSGGRGFYRPYCRSGVNWSIGIGFPFYGGYYPYYPGYYSAGFYPSGYGYYPASYGYGYSPYSGSYYGAPVHGRPVYGRGYRGSTIARVQERLARSGYYSGTIDGIMGPRTRSAIRAYERRHGLPADGAIDSRLLEIMGLA